MKKCPGRAFPHQKEFISERRLTGLDAEGEFGPRGDGGWAQLGAGRPWGHGESPLAGHHVQHLALGSLRPQGADLGDTTREGDKECREVSARDGHAMV